MVLLCNSTKDPLIVNPALAEPRPSEHREILAEGCFFFPTVTLVLLF